MPRIFTGLEIPPPSVTSCPAARRPARRALDRSRELPRDLRFIGEVDGVVAREVASLLGIVRRTELELRFDALTSFGGRRPRALVATLAPTQALMDLQAEHERLLRRVGLDAEGRKYTPHVTLARLRESSSRKVADYLSARVLFGVHPFRVQHFVLFSSRASVGGGPYVVDAAYPSAAEARPSPDAHPASFCRPWLAHRRPALLWLALVPPCCLPRLLHAC